MGGVQDPRPPRTFTRQEAERLLPEVDRLMAELQRLLARLDAAGEGGEGGDPRRNGHRSPNGSATGHSQERPRLLREVQRLLARVQALGVLVRDPRAGLVDFPALRQGQAIQLCWRWGEPTDRLRWWHDPRTGFAGRQPLD